jgi:hypothetical protein
MTKAIAFWLLLASAVPWHSFGGAIRRSGPISDPFVRALPTLHVVSIFKRVCEVNLVFPALKGRHFVKNLRGSNVAVSDRHFVDFSPERP